jgi:hypothetical protein
MIWTSPESSPAFHVTLMDSQDQQPPWISPPSAAWRMFAVPPYPDTTFKFIPRTALRIFGASSVVDPGAVPPTMNG